MQRLSNHIRKMSPAEAHLTRLESDYFDTLEDYAMDLTVPVEGELDGVNCWRKYAYADKSRKYVIQKLLKLGWWERHPTQSWYRRSQKKGR